MQLNDFGLSTHVLNTASGLPIANMFVRFQAHEHGAWCARAEARTDHDGRIKSLWSSALGIGKFKLIFATGEWCSRNATECFFPEIAIEFQVTDPARHHHVPLLLSPFSYSTYRGS